MKRKELLKTVISGNQEQELPKIWERTLQVPLETGKIITLTGVRRSGKTYHLLKIIKKLLEKGVKPEQILYINFEDERLDLETSELDLILQAYRELHPKINLDKSYFLFDEIQELPGWEKFIARIYNSVSQNIFITGSNATLLSKEIATALRGRTITFEIFPLSFEEFVRIKNPNLKKPTSSANKAKIINLFEEFVKYGGFPEIIRQKDSLKAKILQEYFNTMVLRDLIERYKISQPTILKYFCKRVVGNSACEFSVHKIYHELKSQGYKIGKNTLYAYQDYVETIYLARFIPKYAQSVIKTEMSQKKSYVIDQGLGTALDYKLGQDKGRLLETTIALELMKQGKQVAYTQNNTECDFIIAEKNKVIEAVQVTYNFEKEDTKEREVKGLLKACDKFNLKKGTIVTFDQETTLQENGVAVKVIPGWKYLLE